MLIILTTGQLFGLISIFSSMLQLIDSVDKQKIDSNESVQVPLI